MRYSARDVVGLLRTPVGRVQLAYALRFRAYPLYASAARLKRRRLAGTTRFVAVVGSFGKTTTTRATLAALGDDPERAASHNSWSAIAQRILDARPADGHVVLEVGIDGPGQMQRYADLVQPDVVVVTSIGSEHHRTLGTLERTRDEKAAMVRALRPEGLAVLNGDDPLVRSMARETRARVVTYGLAPSNDVVGSRLTLDWPRGTTLDVTAGGRTRRIQSALLGDTMAYPLLAATAVALAEGRSLDVAAGALERLSPTPLRLEPVELPGGVWLVRDEYKSALETVHAALDLLERIPARRKLVVLGDVSEPPGSQGPIYRELGARLAGIAARVITIGRNHKPLAVGGVRAGADRRTFLDAGLSVERAAELLRAELEPGDVVLLKGRDTQRLERVFATLTGGPVACRIPHCAAKLRCEACPMLHAGWGARRVVV